MKLECIAEASGENPEVDIHFFLSFRNDKYLRERRSPKLHDKQLRKCCFGMARNRLLLCGRWRYAAVVNFDKKLPINALSNAAIISIRSIRAILPKLLRKTYPWPLTSPPLASEIPQMSPSRLRLTDYKPLLPQRPLPRHVLGQMRGLRGSSCRPGRFAASCPSGRL